MKNILRKRLPRFFKRNLGIYMGMSLFIIMAVVFCTSYITANKSARATYNKMADENRMEDGFFILGMKADASDIERLLGDDTEIAYAPYIDLESDNDTEIRVYKNRTDIDIPFVLEGSLPKSDKEIAIERLFAEAQSYSKGDHIMVGGEYLTVSGIIGLPDYVISLKSTGDLLADRKVFGVAIVGDGFFDGLDESKMTYQYIYKFNGTPDSEEINRKNRDIVKKLGENYFLTDFCAIADNTRNNSVVSKMEMNINTASYFMIFAMLIAAFLFALVSIHTFEEECSFVGVLIATGYKKGAILKHYLTIPFWDTFLSSGIGLLLGLTVVYKIPAGSTYNYNGLPELEYHLDPMLFVLMMGGPVLAVTVINMAVFLKKLNLTPLKLIRKDIGKEKKVKTAREMKNVGFLNRFRLRTFLRNKGKYISLVIGVFLAGLLVMFGLGMSSSFDDYIDTLPESAIASYQYVLKAPLQDGIIPESAEKDTISSYEIAYKNRMLAVNVIGISSDTGYLKDINVKSLKENEIIISNIMAEKLGIHKGDVIEIDNKLTLHNWKPTVVEIIDFNLGIYAFTTQDILNLNLQKEPGYYNVVFSDNEITGIDERMVAGSLTKDKIADSARQMKTLMASLIVMLTFVGIVCYIIVMFMLTKMVIDKNALNISLLKVFGYKNKEVNKLYLSQTEVIIIMSVIIFIPLQYLLMTRLWPNMLSSMSGYFFFKINPVVIAAIVILGTVSCLVTNMIHVRHVRNIEMTEALKNRE